MQLQPNWLKKTVLLPVALGTIASGIIVLVALLSVLSYSAREEFSRDYDTIRAQWAHELMHHGDALRLVAEGLMQNADLRHSLVAGENTLLRKFATPIFTHLQAEHQVTCLALLDIQGTPLVAFDHASEHSAALEQALHTGLPQSGLEFDQWGNLRLIEVSPWYDNGTLLGYVLLGADFEQLAVELTHLFGMEHVVATPPQGDDKRALHIVKNTMRTLPASLMPFLRLERIHELENGTALERADQWFYVGAIPIADAVGRLQGWMIPIRDVSDVRAALLYSAGIVIGITAITLALLLFFLYHVTRHADKVLETSGDDLQQTLAQLETAHAEWVESFDAIAQPIFIHDEQFRVLRANRAYALKAGMSYHDLLGRPYWEVFPRDDQPLPGCSKAMHDGGDRYEDEVRLPDGEVYISRSFPIRSSDGNYRFSIHVMQDVTELERVTLTLRHEMRACRAANASHQALVHASSEVGLLQEVCRVACDVGGYQLAWAAYKNDDAEQTLRPAGAAGISIAELEKWQLSWSAESAKTSLSARAVRTATPQLVQDLANDRSFPASSKRAQQIGYAAAIAIPLSNGAQVLGVLYIAAATTYTFTNAEIALLQQLADDLGFGIGVLRGRLRHDHHEHKQVLTLERLKTLLSSTVQALAAAVESRLPHTIGRQQRVMDLAQAIARHMGWDAGRVEALGIAALVHDIGNIHVPAEILAKEGLLSPVERELVNAHTQAGYAILSNIDFPWPIAEMVLQHHELLDGSGYPSGLKGDAILPEAQVIGIASLVDSMASPRPYRAALGVNAALTELERYRGTKYDAAIVDACIELFHDKGYRLDQYV